MVKQIRAIWNLVRSWLSDVQAWGLAAGAGPQLVRRGKRLSACPRVAEGERLEVNVTRLIEEERDRWPG
jgi:hypothetical protein